MPIPLAVPIAGAVVKGATGAFQTYNANKRIKALGKRPSFSITPEQDKSYKRAEREALFGFSPEETNAFQQRIARRNNTIFNRGLAIGGGGVSQAINAAVMAGELGAEMDFASQGARLRRDKIRYADQRGDVISNQRNRDTQERISYRNAVEQALGRAKSDGMLNFSEALTDIPNAFLLKDYYDNPLIMDYLKSQNQPTGSASLPKYGKDNFRYAQPILGYNQRKT